MHYDDCKKSSLSHGLKFHRDPDKLKKNDVLCSVYISRKINKL